MLNKLKLKRQAFAQQIIRVEQEAEQMKKSCKLKSVELLEKLEVLKSYHSSYLEAHFEVLAADEANYASQNRHCDHISKTYEQAAMKLRRLIGEKEITELQERMAQRLKEPIPASIQEADSNSEETKEQTSAVESIIVKPKPHRAETETGIVYDHSGKIDRLRDDLRHQLDENRRKIRSVETDLRRNVGQNTRDT